MSWTITKIASVVLCAMGSGFAFSCFGYTPVLGYIIAGLLLGPSVLAVITNTEAISIFSEMGIILLLFVIGLGLSFEKVKNIWKTSVAFTIASTVGTYFVLLLVGWMFGMSHDLVVLSAFCITLSSTAVSVKSMDSLEGIGEVVRENTFGIHIAQDLIALVMVLIINFMSKGGENQSGYEYSKLIALVVFSAGLFLYFTRYHQYVHKFTNFVKRHGDMLPITIFGICFGSAVIAEIGGFSAPFGAFVAGLILGNSDLKEEVKNVSEPIEEIFLLTFFLGVGLQVNLKFIWDHLGVISLALFYITIGKTVLNVAVLRLFKFSLPDSFIISVLLGHIGEFSFMLAFAASKVGLIETTELNFLISLTALSLFLSPFWLIFAERCRRLTVSALESSAWNLFQMVVAKETRKLSLIFHFLRKGCGSLYHIASEKIQTIIERRQTDK